MATVTWRTRLVGTTGSLLWMASLIVATPSHGGVYCAKGKGLKPAKQVTLREGACKRNERDVTADVVAQFVLQGAPGPQGPQGPQGQSCTAGDNGDGTYTVSCGSGTTAVLTDPAYTPAAYAAADPIRGGTAYGKWWVTQAGGAGTLPGAGVTVGAEFVRCKTCHAWDGRGNAASYATRTGQSTNTASRPDVSTVNLWPTIRTASPTQLFELIKGAGKRPLNTRGNGHPDYSGFLSDAQIWNLVKFMREEWIFPDTLYYLAVGGPPVYKDGATVVSPIVKFYGIGADGDATRGHALYAASCSSSGCHGADGTRINIEGASVGEYTRTKPQELWHKVKFGQITDSSVPDMPPGILTDTGDFADLYRALTDSTSYPDIP